MLYLLIRSVRATSCKYYVMSNITITENAYSIFSLLFHKFISKVKVNAFLNIFLRCFLKFLLS